jgi:heptosyltransferase-2
MNCRGGIFLSKMEQYKVKTNCALFPLDRPCVFQKQGGQSCDNCPHYKNAADAKNPPNVLIIKLGAMGDVLRTTFILEGLKDIMPHCVVHWVCAPQNAGVLEGNRFIDKIIKFDASTVEYLAKNYFDVSINLDLAPESLALATLTMSRKKTGYYLDDKRNIVCSNDYALHWLSMSAYDSLKKANTQTYQHWMSKIAELPKDNYEIITPLLESSVLKAVKFAQKNNIDLEKNKVIGINPGAGKRWPHKKWLTSGFIETAKFFADINTKILLLGGKDDEPYITEILNSGIDDVYSTGTDNSPSDFFALVNLCNIVICGDTMALHAATGLKKNVVALFGPTSAAEIDLYGRGTKIVSSKNCVCCYKGNCDTRPSCMQEITVPEVIEAVKKYL